jgi:hypothetical protein
MLESNPSLGRTLVIDKHGVLPVFRDVIMPGCVGEIWRIVEVLDAGLHQGWSHVRAREREAGA